jgi:Cu(I)/Ag(I) efflux system membrane fusion protein
MKRAIWSVALLAIAAAAFAGGSWYGRRSTVAAAGLTARRVLYYVDPMHPAYKSDKPGIAPDCGMQLEPVYGGTPDIGPEPTLPARPGDIVVSPENQQLIGVRVREVEQMIGVDARHLFGRVAARETDVYRINVGVDGFVRDVSGATTGSHVEKGQWLATFSSPDARQPIQAYLVSVDVADRSNKAGDGAAQMALVNASVRQTVDRLLTLGMSPAQVEEIRQTRIVPANISVAAPASGFVVTRNVTAGQKMEKGAELFRIADIKTVWIVADAFSGDGDDIKVGMTGDVSVPGHDTSLRARLSGVLPRFDPSTQSLKLRFEADNVDYALRPDMFVDVTVQVPYGLTTVVPADAIVASGLRNTVFVERAAGVFEPREIRTGRRFGDRVQVVAGLAPRERIAVSGTFLLDAESRMKVFQ